MADTVEGYLTELKAALAGADPALIQDALYDAEEYLRDASADRPGDPAALAAAIDAYGAPDEIAEAYRDREVEVAQALRKPVPARHSTVLGRFFGVLADPAAWGSLFYMLLALLTGTLYFTLVVTGMSMTVGFAILIIGIPFALLFIAMVRAISLAEGRLVEGMLGQRMPRRPRTVGTSGTLWDRIKSWFADYRTWTTMLYMALQLPLGVAYFTAIVTGLSLSVALIGAPIAAVIYDVPVFVNGDYHYQMQWWAAPFVMLIGVLGFVTTLWLAKGIGKVHGVYAKALLVGRIDGDVALQSEVGTPAMPAPPASQEVQS